MSIYTFHRYLDWHLDWYSINISINPRLTLHRQFVNSQLSVDRLSTEMSMEWGASQVSTEVLVEYDRVSFRCWLKVNQGYQWTLDCGCLCSKFAGCPALNETLEKFCLGKKQTQQHQKRDLLQYHWMLHECFFQCYLTRTPYLPIHIMQTETCSKASLSTNNYGTFSRL